MFVEEDQWYITYRTGKHPIKCDLASDPVFSQDTLTCNAVASNHIWLQMDKQFTVYTEKQNKAKQKTNSHSLIVKYKPSL